MYWRPWAIYVDKGICSLIYTRSVLGWDCTRKHKEIWHAKYHGECEKENVRQKACYSREVRRRLHVYKGYS